MSGPAALTHDQGKARLHQDGATYGYVAHFTYSADNLPGGSEFIPAGRDTFTEKNKVSIGGVTQGSGQQAWIENFEDGTREYGFQVYFGADESVTWTVQDSTMSQPRSATADSQSYECPGGEDGELGPQGPIGLLARWVRKVRPAWRVRPACRVSRA
jgi:hypothetical protein